MGQIVPLSRLQARVPSPVKVLPLSEQAGFEQRPGAESLGMLVFRVVNCDSIPATLENGRKVTDTNKRIAQIGTAVNTSILPPSPLNKDGNNGTDLNNYAFV